VEVTIANRHENSFSVAESKKDKTEFKKNVKFSKSSTTKAMKISKAQPVRIMGRPNLEDKSPSRTR